MSGTINAQVAHAFNHFGLGGRPDDAIPTDPIAWLTAQLSGSDPLSYAAPTTAQGLGMIYNATSLPPHSAEQKAAQQKLVKFFHSEQADSLQAAIETATPFRERLVRFWTNHFAIQGFEFTFGTAGSFVREAIRPYVTDTFANMFLAVMQHPAMLCSLNNNVSMGPDSQLAQRLATGGINENLARESMELFTIGLGANYTQADVDALAYMLTGWTVSFSGKSTGFTIDADMHEPGPQTFLGTNYPGSLFDAYSALQYLATHPLTYANIATKLVVHFTSDTPDPNDIATVTQALSSSGGSLSAAANAIIGLQNAWIPKAKLRTPLDLVTAVSRAVAAQPLLSFKSADDLVSLGQATWDPPFPNGYSDYGADWASGAQMTLRTNWASHFCDKYKHLDPDAVANTALGALISPATTAMLARVHSVHDKLTILFCSPDFQRR